MLDLGVTSTGLVNRAKLECSAAQKVCLYPIYWAFEPFTRISILKLPLPKLERSYIHISLLTTYFSSWQFPVLVFQVPNYPSSRPPDQIWSILNTYTYVTVKTSRHVHSLVSTTKYSHKVCFLQQCEKFGMDKRIASTKIDFQSRAMPVLSSLWRVLQQSTSTISSELIVPLTLRCYNDDSNCRHF